MKEVLQRILSDGEYDPDMETLWKLVGWLIEGDSYETEGEIRLHRNKKGYTCHITCRKPEVAFKVYEKCIFTTKETRESVIFLDPLLMMVRWE